MQKKLTATLEHLNFHCTMQWKTWKKGEIWMNKKRQKTN